MDLFFLLRVMTSSKSYANKSSKKIKASGNPALHLNTLGEGPVTWQTMEVGYAKNLGTQALGSSSLCSVDFEPKSQWDPELFCQISWIHHEGSDYIVPLCED